jgi:quercetin dioxygenase-like cupin family protein
MRHLSLISALATLAFLAACNQNPSSDGQFANGVETDPNHYAVEFENEYVRVIRVKYSPGDVSTMHSHNPLLAVSLTGGLGEFTSPDGAVEVRPALEPGMILADAGDPHSVKSIYESNEEHVFVEAKAPYPKQAYIYPNAIDLGDEAKVELEQFGLRAIRNRTAPGSQTPLHSHRPGVQVFLTDAVVEVTLPSGEVLVSKNKAGTARWVEKSEHSGRNLSDLPLEYVRFELDEI